MESHLSQIKFKVFTLNFIKEVWVIFCNSAVKNSKGFECWQVFFF